MSQLVLEFSNQDDLMLLLSFAKRLNIRIVSLKKVDQVKTEDRLELLRQAAQDPLWIMSAAEVEGFAKALTNSPRVDAAIVQQTGHCMDFHHYGHALQLQQIGFALQCACEAT